jgi:hypothetical protein
MRLFCTLKVLIIVLEFNLYFSARKYDKTRRIFIPLLSGTKRNIELLQGYNRQSGYGKRYSSGNPLDWVPKYR